jgi:hypothetical protein
MEMTNNDGSQERELVDGLARMSLESEKIQSKLSKEAVECLIECLDGIDYIGATRRSQITATLRVIAEVYTEKEDQAGGLILTFSISPSKLNCIPPEKRKRASDLLKSIRVDLEKNLTDPPPGVVFKKLMSIDGMVCALHNLVIPLGINKTEIHKNQAQIRFWGEHDDQRFWNDLEEKWPVAVPSFSSVKKHKVITYIGNCPTPVAVLDEDSDSAQQFQAGTSANSIIDWIDRELLGEIPLQNWSLKGTIGAFVRAQKDETTRIFAITACHVVSAEKVITNHPFLVRGSFLSTHLDVAFLPLKSNAHASNFTNPFLFGKDPYVFTKYWSETLQSSDLPACRTFPPGSTIEKIGYASGCTRGLLLDVESMAVTYEGKEKKEFTNMICVRWLPDDPFTQGGDSGAIYYAVNGCHKVPVAIHCLVAPFTSSHPKATRLDKDGTTIRSTTEVASYGSNLSTALEWFREKGWVLVDFMV